VDVYRGKFVAIAFVNDLGHLCEMLGDLGRALLNYQNVFVAQLFQEELVRFQVIKKGCRLVHCLVLREGRDGWSRRLGFLR